MSPSPRSSIDATAPHSPGSSTFLHNLSHRLRKGSTASHASSQGSDVPHNSADHLDRPENAHSTKRHLLSVIRDDWEYPVDHADPKLQREAIDYRLRDESVSEYETSHQKKGKDDPYRFDNPDDVGAAVARRKARKRRLLEHELSWNEGLRIWTMRRDAWTGAVAHEPKRNQDKDKDAQPPNSSKKRLSQDSKRGRNSSDSTGGSSSSVPSLPVPISQEVGRSDSPIGEPGKHANAETLPDGPYLPIYPPIFPSSHTLRARITPNTYPTIYSKVVVQSMTPNVPIPLDHMTKILVQGWKSEGNWPPQPLVSEQIAGRRKARKHESAFSRWKREQDARRKSIATQTQPMQFEQEDESKGVRKHITGAVKKFIGGRSDGLEGNVDKDLEKMGLTFETDEERIDELQNAYEQQLKA